MQSANGALAQLSPTPLPGRTMDSLARRPRRSGFVPADMALAPVLPRASPGRAVRCRSVLLLNPFYPKDPRASFGKHVLTPTLALTSIAGATPPRGRGRGWGEDILRGTST